MRKFSRNTNQRKNLLRIALRSLVEKEFMVTTDARAKEIKKSFDKLITTAKKATTASTRRLLGIFQDMSTVTKLKVLAEKLSARQSGYTGLVKMGNDRCKIKILVNENS
mgnify:FL=1